MTGLKNKAAVVIALLVCAVSAGCARKKVEPVERVYFQKGSRPAAKDVVQACRDAGLTKAAGQFAKQLAPCVALVGQPVASAVEGATSSRLGGLPSLPDLALWPKHKEKSLAFIAQVRMQDLPGDLPADILPQKGMLYFFYDAEQAPAGYDPQDKGSWRVVYVEHVPESLPAVACPEDIPEEARFKAVQLRLQADFSVPDPSEALRGCPLAEGQADQVFDLYGQFVELRTPFHQLLGHAAPIQGEMKLECQLVSHGLYCGDASGYDDPKAKDLADGASQWRLLLQVDSDERAGMMWDDGGRLYFWITEDDLRDRRFDNVWMISQCD